MAAKLVNQIDKLNADKNFGKFVATKLGLTVFNRSRESWKANFDKADKTKELFKDFIKPVVNPVVNQEKKSLADPNFIIDKSGDENLLKRKKFETEEKKVKKPKKSSYLDDL